MKNFYKALFTLIFVTTGLFAQDNQEVQLVVNGQGKDIELAKANALRSAIEQAYGVFISSKTEIFNDELVKDEIIAVANGNIRDYQVLSEIQLTPELYSATLKATVSIGNLKNFCESKGMTSEFSGSLFGANIKMQKLYEANEALAVKELCAAMKPLAMKAFDYKLKPSEPMNSHADIWTIEFAVEVASNANLTEIETYLTNSMKGLSLSESEKENYIKLNKKVYPVKIGNESVFLRNIHSLAFIQDLAWYIHFSQVNFTINDGLKEISPYEVVLVKSNHVFNSDSYKFLYNREWQSNWNIIVPEPTNGEVLTLIINPYGDFTSRTKYSDLKKRVVEIYRGTNTMLEQWRQKYTEAEFQAINKEITKYFSDSSTAYLNDRQIHKDDILFDLNPGPYYLESFYNVTEQDFWNGVQRNSKYNDYYLNLVLKPKPSTTDKTNFGTLTLKVDYLESDLEKITAFTIQPSIKKTEEW